MKKQGNRTKQPLQLQASTIRNLDAIDLRAAAGGDTQNFSRCRPCLLTNNC